MDRPGQAQPLIHRADRSEHPALARSLATAFFDDPVASYLFPKEPSRLRRLQSFYGWVMETFAAHGAVYADAGDHGAAVWQAPLPPQPTLLRQLRVGPTLALRVRGALLRIARMNELLERARIREPHWYLALLGTEPAAQGRGIGGALLVPVLRQCDEMRVAAYLESSKEENVAFYERHGFRVVCELQVAGGPRIWPMSREPRPSAS